MKSIKCQQCGYTQFNSDNICSACHLSIEKTKIDLTKKHLLTLLLILVGVMLIVNVVPAIWTHETQKFQTKTDNANAIVPTPLPTIENSVESRRQYALGMQAMTDESKASADTIRNVRYTTEGYDDGILVLTADGVSESDCRFLVRSEYGMQAVRKGFYKLVCRNRINNNEWSLHL